MRLCSLTQDLKEKRWNVMIKLKKKCCIQSPCPFQPTSGLKRVFPSHIQKCKTDLRELSHPISTLETQTFSQYIMVQRLAPEEQTWTKLTLQPLLKCTYFLISSTCISFETGEEFCVGKRFFRIAANRKGVSAGGEERYKRGFSHAKHTRRLPAIPLGILFRNPPGETVEVLHKWPSFWKRQTSGLKGSAQEMSNFTNTKEGSSLSVGLFWCGCPSSAGHEDVPIPVCSYSLETWSSDSIYFLPLKQW